MSYPDFKVLGVPEGQVWQLFNVSSFAYYCQKVRDIMNGVCPFCQIDPGVNRVIHENDSWRVWKNKLAPRSGQDYQFIIPAKRHIESFSELFSEETFDLLSAIQWIDKEFDITGGVLVIRSGDPAKNAKSVPHLHVNYHVPTGVDRVEVTIAKSQEDLMKKLPILIVFEKMRILRMSGSQNPFGELSPDEQVLVIDRLEPPKTKQ
jgi:diadenosine tetraphosphate (Ap4A) HIT family hydrolase